jgi:hypothetical protein
MSRGDAVFAVTLVFFTLASVFVGMRMISRLFIVKKIDWDDGLMGIAWVSRISGPGRTECGFCTDILRSSTSGPGIRFVVRHDVCRSAWSRAPGCW